MASNGRFITNQKRMTNIATQGTPYMRPPTAVVIEFDQKRVWIGNMDRGRLDNPDIEVRKRANIGAPGVPFVGFKVILGCNSRTHPYIEISITVDSRSCTSRRSSVGVTDRLELVRLAPSQEKGRTFLDQNLSRIDFIPHTGHAFVSSGRPSTALQTSNSYVMTVYDALQSINQAKKVTILTRTEPAFERHLDQILESNQNSRRHAEAFKFLQHPIPQWMSNHQTQMVAGMAELPNKIFYEEKIVDGVDTSLSSRPTATNFKAFVRRSYSQLKEESLSVSFPIFLNVLDGVCQPAEDQITNVNTQNFSAGIDLIQKLIAFPPIRTATIGIVTTHRGQLLRYEAALKELRTRQPGYTKVSARILSQMRGMQMDLIIFDMVRTENFEHLQQFEVEAGQLHKALTMHRDGFVMIGKLAEDSNHPNSPVHDVFYNISKWFRDNDRVVDVPGNNLPNRPVSVATQQDRERSPPYQGLGLKRKASMGDESSARSNRSRTHFPLRGPTPHLSALALRPYSRSPSVKLEATPNITEAADISSAETPSATVADPPPPDLPRVVASNVTRYRAIRQFFAAIHGPNETSPAETQLLLKLSDALLDEDDANFERHYNQLWRSGVM